MTSNVNDWKSFMNELNSGKMIMTPWFLFLNLFFYF